MEGHWLILTDGWAFLGVCCIVSVIFEILTTIIGVIYNYFKSK